MRHIQETAVFVEKLGYRVLDGVAGRVRELDEVAFAVERTGAAEIGEGEGCDHICTLKQLWMVADLPELHDEVHQRAGGVCVAQVRRLLQQVLYGDVGQQPLVQRSLPCTEIDVDVLFDLNRAV